MSYLQLSKNLILAEGGERICYNHPSDTSKIIKIEKHTAHNEQNKLEEKYYRFLEKQKASFEHIVKCYGFINTNLGEGLLFDKVVDYDGKDSQHFRYYLRNNLLDSEIEEKLLGELQTYLMDNNILFIDVSTVNLFCQEIAKDSYKLVIFDGLGARRYGFKFFGYMLSKNFTRYKVKKQWKLFFNNYKRDKKIAQEK